MSILAATCSICRATFAYYVDEANPPKFCMSCVARPAHPAADDFATIAQRLKELEAEKAAQYLDWSSTDIHATPRPDRQPWVIGEAERSKPADASVALEYRLCSGEYITLDALKYWDDPAVRKRCRLVFR